MFVIIWRVCYEYSESVAAAVVFRKRLCVPHSVSALCNFYFETVTLMFPASLDAFHSLELVLIRDAGELENIRADLLARSV